MTDEANPMTAQELSSRLHAHFIRPEDRTDLGGTGAVYLTEVTAPGGTRRADAVHIGLWQNRGAGSIDVCEIKTSLADFRRELDKPAKAEAWWPYSSTFCIVAPHTRVAPVNELPPGWGLMVPNSRGRRFTMVIKPERRQPELTLGLLITLLKNTETTRVNDLRRQQEQLYRQHSEEMQAVRRERGLGPDHARRLDAMDRFDAAMGAKIGTRGWDGEIPPELAAEGLAEFMQGIVTRAKAQEEIERHVRSLERIAERAAEEAAQLRKNLGGLS